MIYHVISRGNAKQLIFRDDHDCRRYLEVLARGLDRFQVRCLGYCLLGNHLHLLLQPDQRPISRLLQQVNSTYCQWFNRRHQLVGHVLQGRYKAVLVESSDAFVRVLRYVMLNPVAAGLVTHPADWRWCSYRAMAGLDHAWPCVDTAAAWRVIGYQDRAECVRRLPELIGTEGPERLNIRGPIFGSDAFVRQFAPLLVPHRNNPDFVRAEKFAARPPLGELFSDVSDPAARNLCARRAFQDHAYTLREIGEHIKRPAATIWYWIRRAAPPRQVVTVSS
jgi:REP element-mobilizing transposase RayT